MRLTDRQKAEVVTDFAAGKSQNEIAKKFKVSQAAISKILNNRESYGKVIESYIDKAPEEVAKLREEIQEEIIDRATNALYYKDYAELGAETLLKIIERMTLIREATKKKGDSNEVRIVIERNVVDLTKDD